MEYHNFWPAFKHPNTFTGFFDDVFKDVVKLRRVKMYSVFGNAEPRDSDLSTNICYSGEPRIYKPDSFDLNIVMDHKCPNSVMYPLFAVGSYACDYWADYCKPRPDPSDKSKFCSFIVSNPHSTFRRKFFRLLSEYKRVDSLGMCDNNTGILAPSIPQVNGYDVRGSSYLSFLRQYKFMICFENTQSPYYLTEKLQNAWLGGTIPVYWGASKALEWLNPKAFIYITDQSDEALHSAIQQIMHLDQNNDAYLEMYSQPLLRSDTIPCELSKEWLAAAINQKLS